MNSATWERAKEIFDELADRPDEERQARLDQVGTGEPGLRASLEKLLAAHRRAGAFLREPTVEAAALVAAVERSRSERLGPEGGATEAAAVEVDRRIGRYKLLERIGEGGFGTVYMAEQSEPVRRRVALKVIKPGVDSRQVVARFEAERQALALMDHENIAKVHDGGEADGGRPYFVMELVRGVPITKFCDDHRLTTRQRLELFVPVCLAVQHAHQKGVIHRDLKPSNVLVTLHDGKPVPKVIDFGIAKAIHAPLTEKTLFTEFRQLIGTPTYMSPEQAELSGLDVDTRSDVYSLGVLLYELLTGTTPFDARRLLDFGVAELQRTIREVEPPRPSTRVGAAVRTASRRIDAPAAEPPTSPEGAASQPTVPQSSPTIEDIARVRQTDPQSLRRALRGDLDWIVMKCLEKDRARRYGTASDLAADIQRHLRDEPVQARSPGTLYRLTKLVRRHRAAVLAAAAVALALGGGFAASLTGFLAARTAQHAAERHAVDARRAAAKAAAASRFLQETLSAADPAQTGKRDMTVREAIDRARLRVDAGSLASQPDVEATVRMTIGQTYAGLALFDEALEQLDLAIEGFRALYGENHADYAEALHQRGVLWKVRGDFVAAERDMRAALEINRRLFRADDLPLAANLNNLACVLGDLERFDEAESLLREALRIARRPEHAGDAILSEVLNNLSFGPRRAGDWASAEALVRESIEVNRRVRGGVHPSIATNLDNLAQILDARGDVRGAEERYREALAMRRQLYGGDHPDVAWTLHNLATLLWRKDEPVECEAALRESLEILRRIHGLANLVTLHVLDSLVSVLGGQGRLDEAEALLLESFDAIRDDVSIPAARKVQTASTLAQLYTARGESDRAALWTQTAERLPRE